jgi:hypothetical protein
VIGPRYQRRRMRRRKRGDARRCRLAPAEYNPNCQLVHQSVGRRMTGRSCRFTNTDGQGCALGPTLGEGIECTQRALPGAPG